MKGTIFKYSGDVGGYGVARLALDVRRQLGERLTDQAPFADELAATIDKIGPGQAESRNKLYGQSMTGCVTSPLRGSFSIL